MTLILHDDLPRMSPREWVTLLDSLLKPLPRVEEVERPTDEDASTTFNLNVSHAKKILFLPKYITLDAREQCSLLYSMIQSQHIIPRNCLEHFQRVLQEHECRIQSLWTKRLFSELSELFSENNQTDDIKYPDFSKSSGIYRYFSDNIEYLKEIVRTKPPSSESTIVDSVKQIEDKNQTTTIDCSNVIDDVIVIDGDSPDQLTNVTTAGHDVADICTNKRRRSTGSGEESGDLKRAKITDPNGEEPAIISDHPVPESLESQESMMSSQSQVVKDCPLVKYDGTLLSSDDLIKLGVIKEALRDDRSVSALLPEDLTILCISSIQQCEEIFALLEISDLSEVHLSTACVYIQSLVTSISHSNVVEFTRQAFLSKINSLTQPISRGLHSCLMSFSTTFPRAVIEAVLTPCVETAEGINVHQSECFCQLTTDVFNGLSRTRTLESILHTKVTITEGLIDLLHSIFNVQTHMNPEAITRFLSLIENDPIITTKNLKFTQLLLLFIKSYSENFSLTHVSSLSMIGAQNKTFLKRSLQSTITKIHA